jgi:hypothetical protein
MMGDSLTVQVEFAHETPLDARIGLVVSNGDGVRLLNANNRFQPSGGADEPSTSGVIKCELGVIPLVAGIYSISLWFGDMAHDSHIVESALTFEVVERDIWGLGRVPPRGDSLLWWPTTFTRLALE